MRSVRKSSEVQRLLGARLRQPILTLGQDPGLASLFEQMLSLLERGYSAQNLLGASLCLAQVVARVALGSNRQNEAAESAEERIENVVSLMLDSLDRSVCVDELASTLQAVAFAFRGAVQEADRVQRNRFFPSSQDAAGVPLVGNLEHTDQGNRGSAGHRRSALFLAQFSPDLWLFAHGIPAATHRLKLEGRAVVAIDL